MLQIRKKIFVTDFLSNRSSCTAMFLLKNSTIQSKICSKLLFSLEIGFTSTMSKSFLCVRGEKINREGYLHNEKFLRNFLLSSEHRSTLLINIEPCDHLTYPNETLNDNLKVHMLRYGAFSYLRNAFSKRRIK